MGLGLCQCTYPAFFYDPSSPVVVTIELLITSLIVTICAIVNYKFRKKLKELKRRRPLGRKGNVVEPLMSWYCIIIIFGTTYILLLHWQYVNEIIPLRLESICEHNSTYRNGDCSFGCKFKPRTLNKKYFRNWKSKI